MAPKAQARISTAKSAGRRSPPPAARRSTSPAARRSTSPAASRTIANIHAAADNAKVETQTSSSLVKPQLERSISNSIIECFRRFDATGEGKISRAALARVIEKLDPGINSEKLFDAMDLDANGVVDYSEFVDWMYGVGNYTKEGSDARAIVDVASRLESSQDQLDRCLKELAECELAIQMKPQEIRFEPGDDIGLRFGHGHERQANLIMKVDNSGVAARAGVKPGWRISEVSWGGQHHQVTGTVYVPDLIMEAQLHGSVCIKFLSTEALERQRAAEFRLPELLAALDIAQKRHNNAIKPLEYKRPEPKPVGEQKKEEAPEHKEDGLPTDALAALAKYQEESQGMSVPPTYEELQEAMGKESWTKWRKGMGPQEWLEMMGIAHVDQDDPYRVLGVDPSASQEELKIAFRERAREFHPDKFPEDPESAAMRFDCIKKCYDRVRTEDARAKTDKQMGITDFFTLYMSEGRLGRQRMMNQMIAIKDDLDALPREAGLDDDLKRQGLAVVKYHQYKLPFKVSDGHLAVADIDAIYGLTDMFPGGTLMLAEWRRGDCHILRPGDPDTGESAVLKQERGFFCDVQPGMTYHMLVQEKA